jgi:hypothetical protein
MNWFYFLNYRGGAIYQYNEHRKKQLGKAKAPFPFFMIQHPVEVCLLYTMSVQMIATRSENLLVLTNDTTTMFHRITRRTSERGNRGQIVAMRLTK